MATARNVPLPPPTLRCESPPPDLVPTPALGAIPELSRCLSAASSASHGSATTGSARFRESVGSDVSALSRASSASFAPNQTASLANASRRLDGLTVNTNGPPPNFRQSTGSYETIASAASASSRASVATRRRGYMRPQGTDFAASARSRESVLSLGSIAHLQYYFARTGLLDGKGGQLARKRQLKAHTLDLSALDPSSFLDAKPAASDHDSSYASLGSSPDLTPHLFSPGGSGGSVVESPTDEGQLDEEFGGWEDWEDADPNMLPPTASTYMHREKPVPRPPTIEALKDDLTAALRAAKRSLREARDSNRERAAAVASSGGTSPLSSSPTPTPTATSPHHRKKSSGMMGWYEVQGMHLLDVVTLAIRAAKIYYTAHDEPERLASIKPERELRTDLLTVMDVLRKMATRGFAGGMRPDEFDVMDGWISRVRDVLRAEEDIEAEETAERKGWAWLDDAHPDWKQQGGELGRQGEYAREEAFMRAMLAGSPDPIPGMEPLPKWIPMDRSQMPPKTDTRQGDEGKAAAAAATGTTTKPTSSAAISTAATSATARTRAEGSRTTTAATTTATTTTTTTAGGPPTAFLAALRSGVRLVQLHNCAVRRSRRRFGHISTFYVDTRKSYRAADNLRYWAKAAELRWEVLPPRAQLGADAALALQYDGESGDDPSSAASRRRLLLWAEFEDAVLAWCRVVRGEITAAVRVQEDKEKARRLHQAQKSISSVMGQ